MIYGIYWLGWLCTTIVLVYDFDEFQQNRKDRVPIAFTFFFAGLVSLLWPIYVGVILMGKVLK